MIRRLIILLLIVGCVFGDTIIDKRLLLGEMIVCALITIGGVLIAFGI